MMFPQLGPQYYEEKHRDVLSRMEAFYAESITIQQSFWGEADTDTRFFAGDQTLWNDLYGNLPANRRRQFSFNRIRRIINMISGHQRRNRKSMIAMPVENGDAETADQYTKVLFWIAQQEGMLETISESFEGSLVTGMNLLHLWVDYRTDPVSGNIKLDNCSYNSFLIDPYFRKSDLSDCKAIWKRSYLTKRQCISLLPDASQEILGLQGNDDNRDGKFQFMPESYNYGMKNLLPYDEFYYRDYRVGKMLVDTQTGETMEWKSNHKDSEDRLREYLRIYPQVTVIEQDIPTCRVAIIVQNKVFYDGPNPLGIDSYPFVPVFAYYAPQMPYFPWRVQGVVRGLRDSQYLYNRRKVIELDILESQINSGFKYKENALVNPADIWNLSGQGKGLALKEEAQMSDVEQIIAPSIPPSMIELSKLLGEEIGQISGVNEELLGSAVDDKAGVLSMLRQGAGLTTLQSLFDQLDRSQKLLGKLILDIIQANFTPGKIKKVLEGQEPLPQFYNKAFGKYDVVIEEGINTATQKQMQFVQLLQLREIGIPIPDSVLLESSTLQNKKELVDAVQRQAQQAQQMQQVQTQISLQELQSRAQYLQAKSQSEIGLAHERESKAQADKAQAIQKIHEANKNDEQALLEKVKALKEIQSMDLAEIQKLVEIMNMVKQNEAESANATLANFIKPVQPQQPFQQGALEAQNR